MSRNSFPFFLYDTGSAFAQGGMRSMFAFWMGGAGFDDGSGGGARRSPPFFSTYGRFGWRA